MSDEKVFPAYAGVSPVRVVSITPIQSLPRLRGGEPYHFPREWITHTSSPPTRG